VANQGIGEKNTYKFLQATSWDRCLMRCRQHEGGIKMNPKGMDCENMK
jgi:hypothetical protein